MNRQKNENDTRWKKEWNKQKELSPDNWLLCVSSFPLETRASLLKEPPSEMLYKHKQEWSRLFAQCVKEFSSSDRMDEVEDCLGNSKNLASYIIAMNELGKEEEIAKSLIKLKDENPAFYGQTLKDIGRDDEFDTDMKARREDYLKYTSYCIGLETKHKELRAAKKLTTGKI